jgi:LysM repeat protein
MNPGDSSGEATPVPIPNTEVKLSSAEDTERAAFRENRSSPGFLRSSGVVALGQPKSFTGDRSCAPGRKDVKSADGRPTPLGYPSAMNGVEQQEGAPARSEEGAGLPVPPSVGLPSLCPYLATVDGTWRSASPVREHRCMAVTPPVPLAFEKQRRLCLVANFATCATYDAAVAARPAFAIAATRRGRAVARTTPVILDQTRFDLRLPAFRADRISGQGLLVAVLVLAFVAILLSRPGGGTGASNSSLGNASVSPGPTTAAVESTRPRPSPVASGAPVVTARPIGSPTPIASTPPASPPPSQQPATSGSTYKVKSGDTLTAIAARFGTTVKVLADLNHMSDPSKLHVGQVLQLP